MIDYHVDDGKLTFKVKVSPRASRTSIIGEHDGMLRIQLAAPPVDGAANDELVQSLAKAFKVPRSSISIASGLSSRIKRVVIIGDTEALIRTLRQCARQG